jgi:hypothetical protein
MQKINYDKSENSNVFFVKCCVCGKEFKASGNNRKRTCSDDCRRDAKSKYNEKYRKSHDSNYNVTLDDLRWTLKYDPDYVDIVEDRPDDYCAYNPGSKFSPICIPGRKRSYNDDAFSIGTIFENDDKYYTWNGKSLKEITLDEYKKRIISVTTAQ